MSKYQDFLNAKARAHSNSGFHVSLDSLNPSLFDWQKAIVRWALRKGKAALFEGTGLGKTIQELAWSDRVCNHTGGDVLMLAPLAVAEQTQREGAKFNIPVTLCRSHADVMPGINITNYEMIGHFNTQSFAGVVLDECSVIKSHNGALRELITSSFSKTPYRLAASATPSPNDYIELGTQAEFLGVMSRAEMLATFFTHNSGDTSEWVLKGHAQSVFWKWVCSWSIMLQNPSDIGFDGSAFILPPLVRHQHVVDLKQDLAGYSSVPDQLSLMERRRVRKASLTERVAECASIVNSSDPNEQWLVWCDLNDESRALTAAIEGAVEVTGSDSREFKIQAAVDFVSGKIKRIVTKSSIWGYGLNLQNCSHQAFVGLSDSFEQIYQATRRCWRFGQKETVHTHIITSKWDGPVVKNIERKERDFEAMQKGMIEHITEEITKELSGAGHYRDEYTVSTRTGEGWEMRNGDCVEHVATLDNESVDFTLFSPPFSNLFCYSNSVRDMGNSATDFEFQEHFGHLVSDLFRVTRPGRIVAFHCMNIPAMKERDGYIGIKDFRGILTRMFMEAGFIFHSEHVIWKDPLIEAVRTKALGLMHKQLCKDSSMSRAGLPDYLVAMRKPGVNTKPIAHKDGLMWFAGENPPATGVLSHERWRRIASPIWMDINQSRTLNKVAAREKDDMRHICPLQLDVCDRALELWSAEGDLVLSPFAGIASEGYSAVRMGRRFLGFELKKAYFDQGVNNLRMAERKEELQLSLSSVLCEATA